MKITISEVDQKYFGPDDKGQVAVLRAPGLNGEPKEISTFKQFHERCLWFYLCQKTFPDGYAGPEQLFKNWVDFPQLHQYPMVACDEKAVTSIERQLVQNFK
jgi:hypothetical protein